MDKYAPQLMDLGQTGMIGKGKRSKEVIDSMKKEYSSVFCRSRRCRCIVVSVYQKSEVIAYDDLGTEAIRKLYVEKLPVITVIDCQGNNMYESASEKYKIIFFFLFFYI